MVANGYCNDETNNPECFYDGGDCCGSCVLTEYCSECLCLTGFYGNSINALVGDGICQNETNIEECNYDGGDCICPAAFIGDGVCDDEYNNEDCYYDGFDCCVNPVNTGFCSNCTCHGKTLGHFCLGYTSSMLMS